MPLNHGLQVGLIKWTERPSAWIKGLTCNTYPDLLTRNHLSGLYAPFDQEVGETGGRDMPNPGRPAWERPASNRRNHPPPSREDQERPREGQRETEKIPGRPAWERPAGPTLQRLKLIFAWKLRQPTFLHTTDASAKYRPLASINRPPILTLYTHQGVLSSLFYFLE